MHNFSKESPGKLSLGRPRRRWMGSIKMDIKEVMKMEMAQNHVQ
jgi:hypothetical protein